MEPIPVPKPSKKARNPERDANALLLAQVSHLQHAERRLPLRYRSDVHIYSHAIKTESEAAEYIRTVTEAIHRAHADAEKRRDRRKRGFEIAAVAEKSGRKKKSMSSKRGKKK